MAFTIKKDKQIIKLLKVQDLGHIIAYTSKGNLMLNLRESEHEYYFTLDSVPLDKETSKELMELLYGIEVPMPKIPEGVKEVKKPFKANNTKKK